MLSFAYFLQKLKKKNKTPANPWYITEIIESQIKNSFLFSNLTTCSTFFSINHVISKYWERIRKQEEEEEEEKNEQCNNFVIALKDCSNKFDETRPPPSSLWDQRRRPPTTQLDPIHRVINLLNSAISPWNPSCTLAAAATFWKYPVTRVVPLWGKHRCNITVPWTPFFSPFFFHDARNHARPTRDSLPGREGGSYILMGNHRWN